MGDVSKKMAGLSETHTYTNPGTSVETKFSARVLASYVKKHGNKGGVKLGAGAFGAVFRISLKGSDGIARKYAMKVFKAESGNDQEMTMLDDSLYHKSLVTFCGAVIHDNKIYLMMEMMEGTIGDLRRRLVRKDPPRNKIEKQHDAVPEVLVARVLGSAIDGLLYLYNRLIYHCDIKMANVLYKSEDLSFKLADFGATSNRAAAAVSGGDINAATKINVPPDMATGNIVANQSLDIWALGLMIYEFALGIHPVKEAAQGGSKKPASAAVTMAALKGLSLNDKSAFPLPDGLYGDDLRQLYESLTTTDPKQRIRYKTKDADADEKEDMARSADYKGPAKGLVDSTIFLKYGNAAFEANSSDCEAIRELMKLSRA